MDDDAYERDISCTFTLSLSSIFYAVVCTLPPIRIELASCVPELAYPPRRPLAFPERSLALLSLLLSDPCPYVRTTQLVLLQPVRVVLF